MSKNKKILFFGILLFIIIALIFYFFLMQRQSPLSIDDRSITYNTATNKPIKLKTGNTYKIDNKEIKQGYYDVTSIEGSVKINNVLLEEGDKLLGAPFYKNTFIDLKGDGSVSLSPAKFSKETLKDNKYYFNNQSAYYQAGNEIEEGSYQISVINQIDTPFYLFLNVTTSDRSQTIKSIDVKESNMPINLEIKKGELLEILNWSENETELSIVFSKE